MSGQAGHYFFDRRPLDVDLMEVLDRDLQQQGPDRRSHYHRPGLLMVHRACHFDSLSEMERQPHVLENGLAATFDGRIDNRGDLLIWLRDELRSEVTDVAIAAAAYVRWGEQGLARLIGDWSLVIWDPRSESLLLASDYCGVIPLYYAFDEGQGICWSSSLQSLADWTNSGDDFDESWIAAFLTNRERFDHTVYRRILAVPPSHAVRLTREGLTIRRFWSPSFRDVVRFEDDRRYEEELLHLFREAVAVRLRSNRPVASDLTGGLDSSSTTCMAHELVKSREVEAERLITFTELDHCTDDERHARMVLNSLDIDHISCDMEPTLAFGVSQPWPAKGPLRREVRAKLLLEKDVRVNLTGDLGDFIMGNQVDDCEQIADSLREGNPGDFLAGAYAWSRAMNIPIYQVLRRALVPFSSPDTQKALWKEQTLREVNLYRNIEQQASCFTSRIISRAGEKLFERLELCNWSKSRPGTRRFFSMLDTMNLSRVIETPYKVEPIRMTSPYMHRPLVEYVGSIPRSQLSAPGVRRSLMRRAFRGLLPQDVLKRKTKGLMTYQYFMEAKELLFRLPPEAADWECVRREWVTEPALSAALDRISKGTLHEWSEIKYILMLELWLNSRSKAVAKLPLAESAHTAQTVLQTTIERR